MKINIRLVMVLISAFVALLSGRAVESYEKLPMFGGRTNLENWVGTNTTYVSVNVWQSDEDGNTLGYYLNAVNYTPSSFIDMKEKLWQTIERTAKMYLESGQYDPRYKMMTYCGTSHSEYIEDEDWFFGGELTLNKVYGTEFKVTNGIVDRSSVEKTPVNFVRDIGFRFDTKAESVVLRVDGETTNGAYVGTDEDTDGGVFVRSEYLSSSSQLEISITFRDGTTLSYDSDGNLIGDYTPKLSIKLSGGSPLIEVVGLLPNQTVELESSKDMEDWTPYPGKVRAIRPTALPTEDAKFFRIKQ